LGQARKPSNFKNTALVLADPLEDPLRVLTRLLTDLIEMTKGEAGHGRDPVLAQKLSGIA
jgi:hypothetical protein